MKTAMERMAVAKSVDEYLARVPEPGRAALEKLRRTIRSAAPEAVETISYQIPVFKHCGMLVGFAAFKEHLTLFVMSVKTMKAHREALKDRTTTAGGVHFTTERPLPVALVRKLVRSRVRENESRDRLRRQKKRRRS
jgi:uncharacterized protein YdhG (YjbR/CyaY superfamily)